MRRSGSARSVRSVVSAPTSPSQRARQKLKRSLSEIGWLRDRIEPHPAETSSSGTSPVDSSQKPRRVRPKSAFIIRPDKRSKTEKRRRVRPSTCKPTLGEPTVPRRRDKPMRVPSSIFLNSFNSLKDFKSQTIDMEVQMFESLSSVGGDREKRLKIAQEALCGIVGRDPIYGKMLKQIQSEFGKYIQAKKDREETYHDPMVRRLIDENSCLVTEVARSKQELNENRSQFHTIQMELDEAKNVISEYEYISGSLQEAGGVIEDIDLSIRSRLKKEEQKKTHKKSAVFAKLKSTKQSVDSVETPKTATTSTPKSRLTQILLKSPTQKIVSKMKVTPKVDISKRSPVTNIQVSVDAAMSSRTVDSATVEENLCLKEEVRKLQRSLLALQSDLDSTRARELRALTANEQWARRCADLEHANMTYASKRRASAPMERAKGRKLRFHKAIVPTASQDSASSDTSVDLPDFAEPLSPYRQESQRISAPKPECVPHLRMELIQGFQDGDQGENESPRVKTEEV
eukprot:55515_1